MSANNNNETNFQWPPLESNPIIFEQYMNQLGLPTTIATPTVAAAAASTTTACDVGGDNDCEDYGCNRCCYWGFTELYGLDDESVTAFLKQLQQEQQQQGQRQEQRTSTKLDILAVIVNFEPIDVVKPPQGSAREQCSQNGPLVGVVELFLQNFTVLAGRGFGRSYKSASGFSLFSR